DSRGPGRAQGPDWGWRSCARSRAATAATRGAWAASRRAAVSSSTSKAELGGSKRRASDGARTGGPPRYPTVTVNIGAFSAGALAHVRPYPKVSVTVPGLTKRNVQRWTVGTPGADDVACAYSLSISATIRGSAWPTRLQL